MFVCLYLYVNKLNQKCVCFCRFNCSPSSTIELLNRLAKVFKDYCGVLTEESIRKNFTLIYELVDEMLDFGYPQITSTELLKSCIHNEAVMVTAPVSTTTPGTILGMSTRSKASSAANVPIALNRTGKQKNEVYVDIIERLTILFTSTGSVINSAIDGSIQMRSFLSGNPELRLALNEDLVIGKGTQYGSVILDDCNFHECVHLDEFESARTLHFIPPDGEFVVLNYRITADYRPPFRIFPSIEEPAPFKLELICLIRGDMPPANHATNVQVRIPVPRSTVGVSLELLSDIPGSTAEYNSTEKKVLWTVKKFMGGFEMSLRVKITLDQVVTSAHKKEVGPISMGFEVPMYNVSNLQVRYLRISETHKAYNPYRWVRYITQSSSYVCRL